MIPELLQYQVEMFLMFFFILGVNQDIVDEQHHELIQIVHEDFVH
jgi:hypothetical protein